MHLIPKGPCTKIVFRISRYHVVIHHRLHCGPWNCICGQWLFLFLNTKFMEVNKLSYFQCFFADQELNPQLRWLIYIYTLFLINVYEILECHVSIPRSWLCANNSINQTLNHLWRPPHLHIYRCVLGDTRL